jgi:hypothetical protein
MNERWRNKIGKTNSLITSNISSLLQKGTQTLKSVNLGFLSFNFFNLNPPLKFSIKSYQNLQNTPVFILKIK